MRFVSFLHDGRPACGLMQGEHILLAPASAHADLKAAIAADALADLGRACEAAGQRVAFADVALLPVIPNPGKILCVGLNYEMHRRETGRDVVENPTIFTRFADSQAAHGQDLLRPRVSTDFDYEGELAVVIGKGGRYIAPEAAMAHVAGYACYNDGSVRDWQRHTIQFTPGKNFPQTGGFGPWLVTPDEIPDLDKLRLTTRVNGATVQEATLDHMIFDVPRIIAYCSSFTPLSPGDVIATGTPGGVGAKRKPPLWLKPGDMVEVEITGIGVLRNGIADEAA
ncbi:fumarylacetoacetate hydrolase family protein [Falsiroseomonas selenitidurans]|uniref:Fumarylacetoacetate hydrolase family protein n=1 Tax=Falsiroseomonas selenitidurans TaxID=2716335 RepID=A0ABX1E1V5_9PROT|nr:fumarylacetoacetate hydrolase family protein [Falsiroseomonas selenitidurans]NKC31141.1 fumarylacetoacetate hydrolase family protein [Falsiroseomonas selenitidurans]